MSQLELSVLGAFRVLNQGQPVRHFPYEKVKALLAYLTTESHLVHQRHTLAVLLWEDQTEQNARSNLRKVLSTLRQTLNDRELSQPFLLTTRNTIQVNAEYDYICDVAIFTTHIQAIAGHSHPDQSCCCDCVQHLEQALTLYQGPFLANVSQLDSEGFEDWRTRTRDRLQQQAIAACGQLTAYFEHQQAWPQAMHYAKRQLELEPWKESAHQCLMRGLMSEGQRSAALVQYERCCQILSAELGTAPDDPTIALYEQIRSRAFNPSPILVAQPNSMRVPTPSPDASLPSPQLLPSAAVDPAPPTPSTSSLPPLRLPTSERTARTLDFTLCPLQPELEEVLPAFNLPGADQAGRDRRRLMQKVHTFWIKGVLEQSLYEAVLMDLDLKERPAALASSWHVAESSVSEPEHSLRRRRLLECPFSNG